MVVVIIFKNVNMAVGHLKSTILNFKLLTTKSKRASSDLYVMNFVDTEWSLQFFDHFEVGHLPEVHLPGIRRPPEFLENIWAAQESSDEGAYNHRKVRRKKQAVTSWVFFMVFN